MWNVGELLTLSRGTMYTFVGIRNIRNLPFIITQ